MYKWFLAWRYLHTKLIAFFAIASVTLCVAMVLVVMSVMGGFLDTIRARSRGLHSEIVLEGWSLQGFPYYQEFGDYLQENLSDVVKVSTPAIYTYGIFRVPATTYTKPARVFGIRLDEYVQVNDFGDGLYYNRYYPGSTTLAPQSMPVAGFDESGAFKLPADLEAANARWRSRETDPEELSAYSAKPFEISPHPFVTPARPGDRVFALAEGKPDYVGPPRDGVIVGADLLHQRNINGDFERYLARGADIALTLMPLSQTGTTTGEPPVRVPMRYVDDSRTGIFEIDSLCVYVDFDMLQHKLAMDPQEMVDGGYTKPRANQLLIGLQDGVDLNESRNRIAAAWGSFCNSLGPGATKADERALGFVDVYSWEDLQRPFIAAVEKEKVLVTVLFALISMVAIVMLGCIFYMIVEKKTRDIGILKAVGASSRGVAGLFIAYAGSVGLVGAILGTLIGALFVWNVNDIQDFLASLNPQLRVWSPDVYSFDRIPEVVKRADAIWVASVAVVASMVGSLIPAILAGRVWPVKALRYE
ncbi:MAG: ABC transporter permease [Phycisphaerales bacterium]|nr:MAG: ABC transporter permease [Phycisphaerales bacterium]